MNKSEQNNINNNNKPNSNNSKNTNKVFSSLQRQSLSCAQQCYLCNNNPNYKPNTSTPVTSSSHEDSIPVPPHLFKKYSLKPALRSKRKQTIFWDLDDVVFNSSEVIIDIINNKYRIPNNLPTKSIEDLKDWSYKSIYSSMTQDEIHQLFKSTEFWSSLQVRQDFINLIKSGVLSHYNNVIVTAGVEETFKKKKELIIRALKDNGIDYSLVFSDFFGITDIHNFNKSVVDMSDGIQIDDAFFNLIDTNAKVKILLKNDLETTFNNSFGDYKECLDNLYEVNNFAEIQQMLEFNYADFRL